MSNVISLEGKPAAPDPNAIVLLNGPALATDDPPLEYIVEALGMTAGSGAPHMFAGYGFSGKTMLAQALVLAMAAGRAAWGGLRCTAADVVHADLEQGVRLTKRRYKRLAHAMGIDLAELGDRIVVASRPDLRLVAEHRDRWVSLMKGRALIVIDSWRAACPDVDENSSEVRRSLDLLGSLSEETGCRAIVIHHARKPQQDDAGAKFTIRGSSGFYDGCDAIYVFTAQKGEPIKIACEKAREHGELVDDLNVEIQDVPGDFGPKSGLAIKLFSAERIEHVRAEKAAAQEAAALRVVQPKVVAAVARACANGAPLASVDAIRMAVRAMKSTVALAVQGAIEAGEIHRAKVGRSSEFRPGAAPRVDGGLKDSPRTNGGLSPAGLTEDSDSSLKESSPSSTSEGCVESGTAATEDSTHEARP